MDSGKNLLIARVARHYVERFVRSDIELLRQEPRAVLLTEKMLHARLDNDDNTLLRGKIDRVDKSLSDGTVRLIDYKTGSVEPRDLTLKAWDHLQTEPDTSKVFQLLFYAYLFASNFPEESNIQPGIISLRKHSLGLQAVKLPGGAGLNEGIEKFTSTVGTLVDEMRDIDIPIIQTADEDRCTWCEYKNICNRSGKPRGGW